MKRVLLDEMTPDLRLRFLEILHSQVHGNLTVEAMQRVEPACDTAMKMLDEMKSLSVDDKCRLYDALERDGDILQSQSFDTGSGEDMCRDRGSANRAGGSFDVFTGR